MTTATITSRDRFSFSLFLALSLHAALILGVSFSSDRNIAETSTIEVTLAVANDSVEVEEADFIAASNQVGSGSEADARELTTTEEAPFQNNDPQQVMAQPMPMPEITEASAELLSTDFTAEDQASKDLKELTELLEVPQTTQFDREQLVEEIASLEARITQDRQALAKMPRTKRISSMSTRSADEAAYLDMWRQKCERIGKANYPPGALEGEVLMLVSIVADGTLEEVRILKSSGHRALDQAALATVRQAAPYQPFNVAMRKAYDRLEFTRTWLFSKSGTALRG
jgi:protein TonB